MCGVLLVGAFGAGADFAQIFPGIDPVLMPVGPTEGDGVLAGGGDFQRLQRLVKDGQSAGSELGSCARFATSLFAFVVAERARACVAKELERVVALVAVFPRDIHAGAG